MFEKIKEKEREGLKRKIASDVEIAADKTLPSGKTKELKYGAMYDIARAPPIELPEIPDLNLRVNYRLIFLFAVVVSGIMASWIWKIGWAYLKNPAEGLIIGSLLSIAVRFLLSLIAAILIFKPTYEKINQSSSESWIPPFIAFQNGFLWQDIVDTIIK